MSAQYEMFDLTTCAGSISATSSQALEDGRTRLTSQDTGTCPAGQDHRHVSRSASRGRALETTTPDTSPPRGSISSASAALQSSLGNRLQTLFGKDGSTIYSQRWKTAVTPAGRQYCQLVASARRTSASDCSLERSGWPTPHANSTTGAGSEGREGGLNIQTAVTLAGWPTPTVADDNMSRMPDPQAFSLKRLQRLNVGTDLAVIAQAYAGWPTARATDGDKSARTVQGAMQEVARANGPQDLPCAAAIAGWPTPTTRDHKDGYFCPNVPTNSLLGREVWKADQPIRITADGKVLTGSDAGTVSSGQLNPSHSRWLMGFPVAWDQCAMVLHKK